MKNEKKLWSKILDISDEFEITEINIIDEPEKIIKIHLKYALSKVVIENISYPIYDYAPEREWQHLGVCLYKCYLVCKLPRYINKSTDVNKVITLRPNFANERKGYTFLFEKEIISALKLIKVQKTTARIFNTSEYIVRSIMENAVNRGLEKRGKVNNFVNISIDEKAFTKGHNYASIVIDTDNNYIIDMCEGRKEEDIKNLFLKISSQEKQAQLKRVNLDMWKAFINVIKELAPQALIVHDKFHLLEKLGKVVDKTRKQEVKTQPLLLNQKYTLLKNAENRTENQNIIFDKLNASNLNTTKVWHVKENFKSLFLEECKENIVELFIKWIENAKSIGNRYLDDVVKTFINHYEGIINAFKTNTNSGKHENMNGKIHSIISNARGFLNYERFRINMLFYFSNLELLPLKN